MAAPGAQRMFLLQFGAEPTSKSVSVRGAEDRIIWCPIIGIVVETTDGWVLLEAGFSRRFLDDEEDRRAIYTSVEQPWGLDGEPLEAALAEVGLRPADFRLAAVSHLHCDHSGGIALLARAGVPVAVQESELAFAHQRARLEHAYYAPDYSDPEPEWRLLDGEAEIAPGVWTLPTPGHTPGHMSYRVDLPETGTWLFAVDAADLAENLNDRIPPGWSAEPSDAARAEESLRLLLEEAERLDARLVPGHDQVFWRALRHPPAGHR